MCVQEVQILLTKHAVRCPFFLYFGTSASLPLPSCSFRYFLLSIQTLVSHAYFLPDAFAPGFLDVWPWSAAASESTPLIQLLGVQTLSRRPAE